MSSACRSVLFLGAILVSFGRVWARAPCGGTADFSVLNAGGCATEAVSFDVSNPNPGWTYLWDFGDGTTDSTFQPDHVFENALGEGVLTFDVTLTVLAGPGGPGGANGCSTTQSVSVLALPDPALPSLSAICLGQDDFPDFNLPASTFSGAGIASWSVDWGNGSDTSLLSFNPALDTVGTSYPDLGLYVITVEALGDNGCVNADRDSLFVGTNPSIGSALPGTSITICSPYELVFPILETDNNLDGTTYTVDFDDGGSVTFNHPPPASVSHIYGQSSCGSDTPGGEQNAYAVTFSASNLCGNATNIVEPIRIHQSPAPDMIGLTDVCVGPSFEYEALGSGLIATPTYCVPSFGEWEVVPAPGLQDASSSGGTGFELWTVFPEPGEFDVFLTESHPNCQDSTGVVPVCVYPDPTEAIGIVTLAGCTPLDIQWENLTPNPPCAESGGWSGTSPDPAGSKPGLATQWRWCDLPQRRHLHCDLDNRGARRSEKRLVTVSTSWTITVTEPPWSTSVTTARSVKAMWCRFTGTNTSRASGAVELWLDRGRAGGQHRHVAAELWF